MNPGLVVALLAGAGALWYLYASRGQQGAVTTAAARDLPAVESVGENLLTVENWFTNYFQVSDKPDSPPPELAGSSVLALPRGIRNNNPGNIRYTGTQWKGLASPATDGAFCIFTDARYGIRAMAKILASYQSRGVDSLPEIISTWAPSSENDTQSYILSVSARSGLSPVGIVSREQWPQLIEAIIWHENGKQPYTMATIREGISWA